MERDAVPTKVDSSPRQPTRVDPGGESAAREPALQKLRSVTSLTPRLILDGLKMPGVRPFRSDEWELYRDLRLRALEDAPEAFGSTLEIECARSDEEWADRLSTGVQSEGSLPLIAEAGDRPAGLAWGRVDPQSPDTAHVSQMWVAPEARGRGHGIALLLALVSWAREAGARRLILSVTCGNSPARALYESAGFAATGDPVPLRPGTRLLAQTMQLDL